MKQKLPLKEGAYVLDEVNMLFIIDKDISVERKAKITGIMKDFSPEHNNLESHFSSPEIIMVEGEMNNTKFNDYTYLKKIISVYPSDTLNLEEIYKKFGAIPYPDDEVEFFSEKGIKHGIILGIYESNKKTSSLLLSVAETNLLFQLEEFYNMAEQKSKEIYKKTGFDDTTLKNLLERNFIKGTYYLILAHPNISKTINEIKNNLFYDVELEDVRSINPLNDISQKILYAHLRT